MKTIWGAVSLLNAQERRRLFWLLPGLVLTAVLKVASIAIMAPFLQLVVRPQSVTETDLLNTAYQLSGSQTVGEFLRFLGIIVLLLLVAGNAMSLVMDWALLRFAWMRNHSISQRLFDSYLDQPYAFFLNRNGSELSKNILSEVERMIQGIVAPAFQAVSNGVTALFVGIMLVVVDPRLALIVSATLGLSYFGIFAIVRRRLGRLGRDVVTANRERYLIATETLGGIKEISLFHTAQQASDRYAQASKRYSAHTASSEVIARVPRYFLEAVAFGGLIAFVLYLLGSGSNTSQVVPVVGLYAFAGVRLLPALQQVYQAVSKAHFNEAALRVVERDLRLVTGASVPSSRSGSSSSPLSLRHQIVFEDVDYRYPGTDSATLKNANLVIPAGSSVAFVGTTGSGKTTLIDVLLGLLAPTAGQVLVDGSPLLGKNVTGWQQQIGYVPQSIYLLDASIAVNIAFGRGEGAPDMDLVRQAAQYAQLSDFILGELPDGFDTVVGERGVRLSGGQRQRIGVARALYGDPDVLVLDEATSALDGETENALFQALNTHVKQRTIVMVAHRLSTVRHCDRIFVIQSGRVVANGTFEELLETSQVFRNLANPGGNADVRIAVGEA